MSTACQHVMKEGAGVLQPRVIHEFALGRPHCRRRQCPRFPHSILRHSIVPYLPVGGSASGKIFFSMFAIICSYFARSPTYRRRKMMIVTLCLIFEILLIEVIYFIIIFFFFSCSDKWS